MRFRDWLWREDVEEGIRRVLDLAGQMGSLVRYDFPGEIRNKLMLALRRVGPGEGAAVVSLFERYVALKLAVLRAEKPGSTQTADMRRAYADWGYRDWKKWSALRGYTSQEIADYEELQRVQAEVDRLVRGE